MMWIDGVSPLSVVEAYVAALVAMLIFAATGIDAAATTLSDRRRTRHLGIKIDSPVAIVAAMLIAALAAQPWRKPEISPTARRRPGPWPCGVGGDPRHRGRAAAGLENHAGDVQGHGFPAGVGDRRLDDAGRETAGASWQTALGLGFVSAVFDNIPLTALALKQGGYDWGYLAYAVGFWRIHDLVRLIRRRCAREHVPGGKSVGSWVRHGWPVIIGYVVGFFVMPVLAGILTSPLIGWAAASSK